MFPARDILGEAQDWASRYKGQTDLSVLNDDALVSAYKVWWLGYSGSIQSSLSRDDNYRVGTNSKQVAAAIAEAENLLAGFVKGLE